MHTHAPTRVAEIKKSGGHQTSEASTPLVTPYTLNPYPLPSPSPSNLGSSRYAFSRFCVFIEKNALRM